MNILLWAFVARILVIFFTFYFVDSFLGKYINWSYTDIDYFVYSDAGKNIISYGSPYERVTYRYPPLLALLMMLNDILHPCVGKILFSVFDSLTSSEIFEIREILYPQQPENNIFWAVVWGFNPISIYITTRGSCDSISNYFLLLSLRLILNYRQERRNRFVVLSGFCFGFLIWFRLYPVIYLPFFVLFLFLSRPHAFDVFSCVWFGVTTAISFSLNFLWSWIYFGDTYVNESLLYHLIRKDHRHNFSAMFYKIYLEKSHLLSSYPLYLSYLTLILLLGLFLVLVVYYVILPWYENSLLVRPSYSSSQSFINGLFLQTLVFVGFNKVITGQYFLWFLVFIHLFNFPHLSKYVKSYFGGFLSLIGFVCGWLLVAFLLELQGINVFWSLWTVSLGLLIMVTINIMVFLEYFKLD